jgi:serine/threonine protein kinase
MNPSEARSPLPQRGRAELCGFLIMGRLGEGASSEVFLGERVARPGERRALKVLRPSLSLHSPEERARFLREAEVLRRLQHPHVVRLESLELHEGRPVMILEHLEGEPLSAVPFERRPLGWRSALRIICEAARGVGAAHALDIVHRDLKPANITLTPEGVKVLDFGVAKLLDGVEGFSTQQGIVVGSPAYMAPEVCLGERAGPQADVYALGLIFYHLIMGRHPLLSPTQEPPSVAEMMRLHLRVAPPPLSALALHTPQGLDEVLERACAADPAARYAHGDALAEALSPYLSAPSTPPAAATPRPTSAQGVSALLSRALTRDEALRSVGPSPVELPPEPRSPDPPAPLTSLPPRPHPHRAARASWVWAVWALSFSAGVWVAQLDPQGAGRSGGPSGGASEGRSGVSERAREGSPAPLRWRRVPTLAAHGLREALEAEVTAAQYAACVAAGACPPLAPYAAAYGECVWGGSPPAPDVPLSCVTRGEAEAFARWAGGRLPTPQEWSALMGEGAWPWGSALPSCARAVLMESLRPGCGGGARAQEGCARPLGRSTEGLCDLVGNLWEWGAGGGEGGAPVMGGAWSSPVESLRAPPLGWRDPGAREANVGFRVVR